MEGGFLDKSSNELRVSVAWIEEVLSEERLSVLFKLVSVVEERLIDGTGESPGVSRVFADCSLQVRENLSLLVGVSALIEVFQFFLA